MAGLYCKMKGEEDEDEDEDGVEFKEETRLCERRTGR